jgi:predicted alpha/beta-hydrolase family hydrolase
MEGQSNVRKAVRRRRVRVPVAPGVTVTGAWTTPAPGSRAGGAPRLDAAIALAHGAGGTFDQPLLVALADALAARGACVLRYNFPYTEAGKKAPDRAPALVATVAAAARWMAARPEARGLPLVVGGKSMGGRMASMWLADGPPAGGGVADGLLLVGYPLHPAGQPTKLRAEHLVRVACPMLFLEGTRDPLCDLALLRPVLRKLGRRATLHVIDGGDHSFAVPRALGRSQADVLAELVDACARWLARLKPAAAPRRARAAGTSAPRRR